MPAIWTIKQGSPDQFYLIESIATALAGGGNNLVSATAESLTFVGGDQTVVMKGQFALNAGGEPESGLVEKMKVYDGGELIAKAKGYDLDILEIADAFDNPPYAVIFQVIFNRPLIINGSNEGDFLFAGSGDGRIYGNGGHDEIFGNGEASGDAGRYKLYGGRGNDTLTMAAKGGDELFGGAGKDTFVPYVGGQSANPSKIMDFEVGVDRIGLAASGFDEIGSKLNGREFRVGNKAKDGDDYVIYDRGKLYYDADADGAKAQILLAKIKGDPKLTAGDFLVGDFMFI